MTGSFDAQRSWVSISLAFWSCHQGGIAISQELGDLAFKYEGVHPCDKSTAVTSQVGLRDGDSDDNRRGEWTTLIALLLCQTLLFQ